MCIYIYIYISNCLRHIRHRVWDVGLLVHLLDWLFGVLVGMSSVCLLMSSCFLARTGLSDDDEPTCDAEPTCDDFDFDGAELGLPGEGLSRERFAALLIVCLFSEEDDNDLCNVEGEA